MEALPYLLPLVVWAYATASSLMARQHSNWVVELFGPELKIAGWIISTALYPYRKLWQLFSNALGKQAVPVDSSVGYSLHSAASFVRQVATVVAGFRVVAILLAQLATGNAQWADVTKALAQLHRAVSRVERVATRDIAQVRHAATVAEHAATDVAIPRAKSAWELAQEAERSASRAWRWIKEHRGVITAGGLLGALVHLLTRETVGGLKCNSLRNVLKNRKCGLWSDLDKLLSLLIDTSLVFGICEVLTAMTTTFSLIEPELTGFIDTAEEMFLKCGYQISPGPTITPSLDLPTQTVVALSFP